MALHKLRYGLILVAALAVICVWSRPEQGIEFYKNVVRRFSGHPIWMPAIFAPFYIFGSLALVPVVVLALTAGVLFGATRGAVMASFCGLASAIIGFLLGRKFGRQWLQDKLDRRNFYRNLLGATNRGGWKIVLFIRLTPFFPFSPVNFFLGASKISLPQFISATWSGMMPSAIVFAYLGSLARNITELSLSKREASLPEWGLAVLGAFAMLILLIHLAFYAKKALPKRLYPEEVKHPKHRKGEVTP